MQGPGGLSKPKRKIKKQNYPKKISYIFRKRKYSSFIWGWVMTKQKIIYTPLCSRIDVD